MDSKKTYQQVFSKPILLVGILLIIAGVFSYTKMQTNLFPEVLFPRITIIADAGQLPIDRMLITVTKPVEGAVKRVKGVTVVRSSTSRGTSTIDIFFEWGLNTYEQKTQIESRINEIKNFLPPGVNFSIEAMNQSLFPVYGYTLENPNASQVALRDEANLTLRPIFSQVTGISNVVVRGGRAKDFVVIPDVKKMSSLGITPTAMVNVFNNNNFVLSNGYIADYNRLYLSLTDTRVNDVDELNDVIIKSDSSRVIRLKDIAKVEIQEQQEFVIINANGSNAVSIDLVKQPGVNLVDFANDVEKKAVEARKLLPKGYKLKPYYNQSAFVSDSIHSVIKTIYEGLFLAILVMIVFLRSWRASLAVMLTIPVTLAFTIILLYCLNITINIMSLGAIAASIGLMIDDAIVIIEQIYRTHEEHPEKDKYTIVREAIRDLFPAMVGSSLATIVIHFPFGLMSGLAGSFFRELSNTMQITLVCSFLVTWLLLPVLHLLIGYRSPREHHQDRTAITLKRLRWLTWFFTRPIIAAVLVLVLGLSAWWASSQMETGFLPDLDEGSIVLDYISPAGTSMEETDRLCREMEKIILAQPEVESYSRRTGIHMAFKSDPSNIGDYSIQLKKDRHKTTEEVISELRQKVLKAVPAMQEISFGQRISDLLGDLISTPNPIEIKIFGDDYKMLQQLAQQAENIVQSIHGITDINNGLLTAGPTIMFIPNREKLALHQITLTDFQTQLAAYTGGVVLGLNANQPLPSPAQAAMTGSIQIGQIQDREQMRRVLLRFTDFDKNDVEKLKRQLIFLPDGTTRPLYFFCDINIIPGEIEQRREDLKSTIIVTARLENRGLGSAIKEIQAQLNQKLALPQGYSIVYGGAYAEQQKSFNELLLILSLGALLVLTVLMFLFKEWRVIFLILFISLMGISGCILALYITGIPLNVSSYTGIIMIVGIIAENAIFTVNQYQKNMRESGDVDESINYAIALRIRPKLMTAIGAILALMPLALGIGLGAQMQQPLAVAVIGGFLAGLPLLLLVFPSFMRLIYKRRKNEIASEAK
ncbi:MAG: acriflavine resistance protein [Flavipsychrobacter sp.]|nr:acriflavine resistance protein [Flavipsychrobacter sp.]